MGVEVLYGTSKLLKGCRLSWKKFSLYPFTIFLEPASNLDVLAM